MAAPPHLYPPNPNLDFHSKYETLITNWMMRNYNLDKPPNDPSKMVYSAGYLYRTEISEKGDEVLIMMDRYGTVYQEPFLLTHEPDEYLPMTRIGLADNITQYVDSKKGWVATSDIILNLVDKHNWPINTRNKVRDLLKELCSLGIMTESTNNGRPSWRIAPLITSEEIARKLRDVTGGWKNVTPKKKKTHPTWESADSPEDLVDKITRRDDDNDEEYEADLDKAMARGLSNIRSSIDALSKKSDNNQARIQVLEEALLKSNETCANILKEAKALMLRSAATIKIEHPDNTVVKLKDTILPAVFQDVLDLASCRINILLTGPAGCGKSTIAKLIAKSLKLPFGKIGGSGGLAEHHLLGRVKPNITSKEDHFQTTEFLERFENGGVCLIDELDGADANALLALNPALDDSGELPVPNRSKEPIALKHKDFICIATANTMGRGASRVYVGRNQLDEATLDRFRIGIVDCNYDELIENAVCPNDELRTLCQNYRRRAETAGLRRIISTRFLAQAYRMHEAKGWGMDKLKDILLQGWTADEVRKVS